MDGLGFIERITTELIGDLLSGVAQLVVGARGILDGFEHDLAVGLVIDFAGDAGAEDALEEDVIAAVIGEFVFLDVADADVGSEGWLVVIVIVFGDGSLEEPHGDESVGIEGVTNHLSVAVFEDVQGHEAEGQEDAAGQGEDADGLVEIDGDGFSHGRL